MERDLEEIRTKIEEFMTKYNVTVRIETTSYGWTTNGKIASPKARIIINS